MGWEEMVKLGNGQMVKSEAIVSGGRSGLVGDDVQNCWAVALGAEVAHAGAFAEVLQCSGQLAADGQHGLVVEDGKRGDLGFGGGLFAPGAEGVEEAAFGWVKIGAA